MIKYKATRQLTKKCLVKSIKDLQLCYSVVLENGLSPFADPDSRLLTASQRAIIIEYRELSDKYKQCLQDYANFEEYIDSAYQPNEKRNGIYVPPTPSSIFFCLFLFFLIVGIIFVSIKTFGTSQDLKDMGTLLTLFMAMPIGTCFALWGNSIL